MQSEETSCVNRGNELQYENELCKSRERIAIRENECKSGKLIREIANPMFHWIVSISSTDLQWFKIVDLNINRSEIYR